jgi:hypothetical protein
MSLEDFINRKRRAAERAIAAIEERGGALKWKVRLRVRLGTRLQWEGLSYKGGFAGRVIEIKSRTRGEALKDAQWIVIGASRFSDIESAVTFGQRLQTCLSLAAAKNHIALDVGADNAATTSTSDHVKAAMAKAGGFLFDDVHGLDILPQTPASVIIFGDANLTARVPPEFLLGPAAEFGRKEKLIDQPARSAALLVNASLLAEHPVARLALSIAAVELISATERWNERQKEWIRQTRSTLAAEQSLTDQEREELAGAVEGMFNFGSLEKTRRLIRRVKRDDLIPQWDNLYKGRSKLFHGSRYLTNSEVLQMAGTASGMCGEIVNAYIESLINGDQEAISK